MSLKRTLINPNLTGLKSWENFDVKNRTIKTPPRYPKNRASWFPYKTQSLPNLSKIDQELLEKDLETAVKDATRNLRCQTLYLLLEVPIVLSNNLIAKILFILLFCSFSRKIRRQDFQCKQRLASLTFTTLFNKIPSQKYPLISRLIRENFWRIYNEEGFMVIWPLRILSILIRKNKNFILEEPNILYSIYKDYKTHYSAINLIGNGRQFHLHEQDYDELKKIIIICSKCDGNFASKMAPQTDVIIFEKLICCKDPSYFHKTLIFKIIRNVSTHLTLKEECRKHVRLLMRKADINYTLIELQLPKCLKQYLMFAEDNSENNSQISELTFWSGRIPKSKELLSLLNGPIFNIPSNYKINCSTSL